MQLELERVTKKVGAQTWLYEQSLAPVQGAVTVLLGATLAGKTSLMRLMAGLDTPTTGRILVDGQDVTGMSVRRRNVAMVYQQFVNYPSLTVAENIASPLRLRGEKGIESRVRELAEKLSIESMLDRYPAELSGGQQQRVALARALVKRAPLILLDEPLVNLDYKLREGLREELASLFANSDSTAIYATTEPGEALLLGGHTAVMDAGELLQYGPTMEVFQRPQSLRAARAFSDPPMNLLTGVAADDGVRLSNGTLLPLRVAAPGVELIVGLRASSLGVSASDGDVALDGQVELAEISGSDTFLHLETAVGGLVAQLAGGHHFELESALTLYFNPAQAYVFGTDGALVMSPDAAGARTASTPAVSTPPRLAI